MNPTTIAQWLQSSALGDYISASAWVFPTIESIHVIAIVTVVGSIAIMDLRLLGWAFRDRAVTELSRDMLRWTWAAFALAAITGLLLFISRAESYIINPYFQWKMALLTLAGLNMLFFHLSTWRTVANWDSTAAIPVSARAAGGLSLAFWIFVVFCGRVVGFTLGVYV
ncbi:DUF6644 family protein [Altericroceibacterium xinjiangense]|uniref:DUF6644 family protein n=1 Tax=Altericroceibacterium xinjiangense TaxID=762261 RepID=UPI000F7F7189|nr:DUF6644 family protein [Altericroceibacterium xinjiangense]